MWYGDGAEPLYQQATDPFLNFNPVRTSFRRTRRQPALAAAVQPRRVSETPPSQHLSAQPATAVTATPQQSQATATPAPATPTPEPLPDPAADLGAYLRGRSRSRLAAPPR